MRSSPDSLGTAHNSQELHDAPENSVVRVSIREHLTTLPESLRKHARSIRVLDLSHNSLSELPDWLAECTSLEVLFASYNQFQMIPPCVRLLPRLRMLGIRANQIEVLGEATLPPQLEWLTLTENLITSLPASIGGLSSLRKLLLAGNHLTTLPIELQRCTELELVRLSANQLKEFPEWLFELPKLAWIAVAGNPATTAPQRPPPPLRGAAIPWTELSVAEELGRGASGVTYAGTWRNSDNRTVEVAIKVFSSTVSSDGNSEDEISAALSAGLHENILTPLGRFDTHPARAQGLVYRKLSPDFIPLASPPSFDSVTRDTYSGTLKISTTQAIKYARDILAATVHLHDNSIVHGDLYAHNTLVNGRLALLSDFGAAILCSGLPSTMTRMLERIESRAVGILLEELLQVCDATDAAEGQGRTQLQQLSMLATTLQRGNGSTCREEGRKFLRSFVEHAD